MYKLIAGPGALLFIAVLAGCGSLPAEDCGTDAYYLGWRDSLQFRVKPQIDAYQRGCAPGQQIDAERYMQGWRAGDRTRRWPPA